ncbi:MAG TPA: cytochrome b N-terminal domain-containing protein [Kofleriaceae bacterium]|jgi:ubiquinol-cytochrome c reductase cytochrome b subunit|nr:cytochrome b N-terminal domain-containing protein [Kofleriaceae bacterium]
MRKRVTDWLNERANAAKQPSAIAGGPSVAHVFGWVLVMLLGVEAITGVALAAFYAPSTTDAWASVAYVQGRMPLGWLVRGLHFHGASALVIVCGVHLLQTAIYGAYKKPREVTWWLGILLMMFVLGFAVSGYVLRWDQAGYWANRVEIGIAASAPGGELIRSMAIGGNEYGNLTLTRFYALHAMVLPALTTLGVAAHVVLARRWGATPKWGRDALAPVARWPQQSIRNAIAMALVFAALLGYAISSHGADLAAPADPSSAFDARPLWYFRWLFELRHLAGSAERVVALITPVIVGGFLIGLPLVDRKPERDPKPRKLVIAGVLALFAIIGLLTAKSFSADSGDAELAKRQQAGDKLASRALALATQYGVPVTGAADVFKTVPMYRQRTLYAQYCKSCHDAQSKDRKGPIIGPGHGDRAWLVGLLKDPSGDHYWGHTKLGPTDDAMKAVTLPDADLDDLVELLYAQSGATDVDPDRADRGKKTFAATCTDCHSIDDGVAGQDAPGLSQLGSRDWYTSVIGNPKKAIHMAGKAEMPRFDADLSIVDRDALAGYLVWLRTATQADIDKLGPL